MANKFRSFLALLGISIGTAAVVGLLYSGLLATDYALSQISAMGTQMVAVSIPQSSKAGFTSFQLKGLATRHRKLEAIVPMKYLYASFKISQASQNASLLEVVPELAKVMSLRLQEGRFLHKADTAHSVCVLGYNVAKKYRSLGVYDLIGSNLYFGNGACLVVGVLTSTPTNFYLPTAIDDAVITKISDVEFNVKDLLLYFRAGVDVMRDSSYALADLHSILSGVQFFDRTPGFLLEHMKREKSNMNWLLGIIGGISLLVGGIGIMNIMLVSVVERRQEIGIRLAIGAKSADILHMFVMESCVLCLVGGLIGLFLGVSLSFLMAFFSDWGYHFYLWPLILGFMISAITGIFFGYYPALRASRLEPVYCLRGI